MMGVTSRSRGVLVTRPIGSCEVPFVPPLPRIRGGCCPRPAPRPASTASDLPSLSRFAQHLERDLDAVAAGLTLPWDSGVVEGDVSRIKMLKHQTFGRAGFELLRKRVLLA